MRKLLPALSLLASCTYRVEVVEPSTTAPQPITNDDLSVEVERCAYQAAKLNVRNLSDRVLFVEVTASVRPGGTSRLADLYRTPLSVSEVVENLAPGGGQMVTVLFPYTEMDRSGEPACSARVRLR